jgi:hypothetical protein
MKNSILLFLFLPILLFSQNSFEFVYEGSIHTAGVSSFKDNENNYITVGVNKNSVTLDYEAFLIKYQNPQNLIAKSFSKSDTSFGLSFGRQKENGNYFFIGQVLQPSPYLYLLETTDDFEIVKEHFYSIPATYTLFYGIDIYFDTNDIIILQGWLDDDEPGDLADIYLAKFTSNGELLNNTIITELNNVQGAEILKKLDGSGYYIYGSFTSVGRIEVDNNLNVIGYLGLAPNADMSNGVRWLPDGNIIMATIANQSVPGAYYDLRMATLTPDLIMLKDSTYFDQGKSYIPDYTSLDYVDPDNIWVVTHLKDGKLNKDWEKGRIFVFNSEMNLKGSKYFSGSLPTYLFSIKALEDGGCIITGVTPKAGKEGEKGNKDIYIKKVMLEDILANAEDTPSPNDRDVLVFPVPFMDKLTIETYRRDLTFSLFTNEGKAVVSSINLQIPRTNLPSSKLEVGIYYYNIYDNHKVIQTGKLIKK